MTVNHTRPRASRRHLHPLAVAFGLAVAFMAIEVGAGLWTGSLALLSDAGHMATDALGLGMALAAIVTADRAGAGDHRTFGLYRLEILAALANALLLFAVAGFVLYEAVQRLQDPPSIMAGPMLVVAVLGLIVNLIGWRLLQEGSTESINVEGAFVEVLADLFGSLAVIAAAVIVRLTGWTYADPLFAAVVALFILPRAWRLGRKAMRVLVQAAPEGLDVDELRARLSRLIGVGDVHDLHVWTLTSDMNVASVHLTALPDSDPRSILGQARAVLAANYEIDHVTLQVEPEDHQFCAEVTW